MPDVSVPYSFFGGNKRALLCRDPEVILSGPAETGKTLAQLFKLHMAAYRYPGAQLAIVRKRKTDITGSAYRTLKRDLLDVCGPGAVPYGGGYPQWIDYPYRAKSWGSPSREISAFW